MTEILHRYRPIGHIPVYWNTDHRSKRNADIYVCFFLTPTLWLAWVKDISITVIKPDLPRQKKIKSRTGAGVSEYCRMHMLSEMHLKHRKTQSCYE